jgi:Glutaminase
MPKSNVIVGVVGGVLAPAAVLSGSAALLVRPNVRFEHGETAFFDLTNLPEAIRQAGVLEALQRTGWPAHVELRRDRVIANVRIPDIGRVLDASETAAGIYEASADSSETRFLIDASTQEEELRILQNAVATQALVVIAENIGGWIFDVQLLPTHLVFDLPDYEDVECGPDLIASTSVLDLKRADDLVLEIMGHRCVLPNASDGCIPFLFAKKGCWTRAHRMCELLADCGVDAAKLWLFGKLRVETPNVSACRVTWPWHAAAFVRVNTGTGEEIRVIDPTIFPDRSASCEEWIGAQNDPAAVLRYSAKSVYKLTNRCRGRAESPDLWNTGIRETIVELALYREMLLEMDPPPPFAHCSPTPPRTTAESSDQAPAAPARE